jgi:hypothetical protein
MINISILKGIITMNVVFVVLTAVIMKTSCYLLQAGPFFGLFSILKLEAKCSS